MPLKHHNIFVKIWKKETVFIAQLNANLINSNDMVNIYEIKTTNRLTPCSSLIAKIKEHVNVTFVCVLCPQGARRSFLERR